MHDTVDDRGGHVAVSKHLAPPSKLQIRTERHAPLLVGIRDDLEQESGPVDIDGQVAQLVDDQQPGAAYRAQSRVEPVLVPRTPACPWRSPCASCRIPCRRRARGPGPVHETEVHELLASPVGGERHHAAVVSVEALDARESRVPDQPGASGFGPAGVLGPEQVGQHAGLSGRGVRDHGTQHVPSQRQPVCELHDLVRGGLAHGPPAAASVDSLIAVLPHEPAVHVEPGPRFGTVALRDPPGRLVDRGPVGPSTRGDDLDDGHGGRTETTRHGRAADVIDQQAAFVRLHPVEQRARLLREVGAYRALSPRTRLARDDGEQRQRLHRGVGAAAPPALQRDDRLAVHGTQLDPQDPHAGHETHGMPFRAREVAVRVDRDRSGPVGFHPAPVARVEHGRRQREHVVEVRLEQVPDRHVLAVADAAHDLVAAFQPRVRER